MTEMTESADLFVPPAAAEGWFVCGCSESGIRGGYKTEVIRLIVAAELRRIADLDPSWTICGPATFLRARADELDPPAGTRED